MEFEILLFELEDEFNIGASSVAFYVKFTCEVLLEIVKLLFYVWVVFDWSDVFADTDWLLESVELEI